MYEGIEDIYRLLDQRRLKEALAQLQGISTRTTLWNLQARIEEACTAYGYMLQYAALGTEDPTRDNFYQQTLRTAYELTDTIHIALLAPKSYGTYFDRVRTLALHPASTYDELAQKLNTFTEEISTAHFLYPDKKRLETETANIHQTHEYTLIALFDKTWATPFWTENEETQAINMLQTPMIVPNDIAVMVSAATLSLLRTFDHRKLNYLLQAYTHDNLHVNQRAIIGITIALSKHETRIPLYPKLEKRLQLLCEDINFINNLKTIQMQFLISRETTKIDKKMREEIMPEMFKTAQQLNNPNFRFDETEDSEDYNPEWEEWMDKSGMNDKIKEIGEWQMAGADIYMSSFAQLKQFPFFHQIAHWFYPFNLDLPLLAPLKKELDNTTLSPLKIIVQSDHFCNSDKYSFALATLSMSQNMRELTMKQMQQQAHVDDEQREKLQQLTQQKSHPKGTSRQYIQDLYRFFKLWHNHEEEEDIFSWPFNLWKNTYLQKALDTENFTKELADYLLQKEYLDEAYSLYKKLMAQDTTQAEIYQKAGYIQQKQKQYIQAIQHYRYADILQPDNLWINKHLAQCHRLVGNLEEALVYYRKVEAVQPDNLNIALQIGQCLARMEQYTEALTYFYKVEYLEEKPDNARRAIAWCSFVTGKYEEALKYYRLLLDTLTPKAHDWMNTAHVYFVMHQVPQAIEHYRQAQSYEESHSVFVEKFYKDRKTLQKLGLSEKDLQIMLDLVV